MVNKGIQVGRYKLILIPISKKNLTDTSLETQIKFSFLNFNSYCYQNPNFSPEVRVLLYLGNIPDKKHLFQGAFFLK